MPPQSPLNDPDKAPDASTLKPLLKRSYAAYEKLIAAIAEPPLQLTHEWRFYKDGKAWLCKITHKKKTVAWLSVWDGHFKLAFYFSEKAGSGITELDIDQTLKNQYATAEPIGKLHPLVVEVEKSSQLADLLTLMAYKMKA